MGFLSTLTGRDRARVLSPSVYNAAAALPVASPWSSGSLERIVFEDIFGGDVPANTREAAMRIPALARGRNLICSTIAGLPLRALRGQEPLPEQPSWLTRSTDGTSPQHKIVWTVDDLIFYSCSLWWRENDATSRFPLNTGRVNMGSWTINDDNQIEIEGRQVDASEVILFTGFNEGILKYGKDALDDTRTLYANIRKRLANPVPMVELHQTAGDEMTDTDIDDLIEAWSAARAGDKGGVGFTNPFIQLIEHGGGEDSKLMIEARNAAAVDMARILGISATLVDATAPKASLNYETSQGRNQEFVDFDLPLHMAPITARLSMDDVTPHGTRIDFDLTNLTTLAPSPVGPNLED